MSDEELQEVKEGKVEVKGASEAEGEREEEGAVVVHSQGNVSHKAYQET